MTIQEAINSGRRFRRPGFVWGGPGGEITVSTAGILATDWEIEPDTRKVLSGRDIRDAAKAVRLEGFISPQTVLELEIIIDKLGL